MIIEELQLGNLFYVRGQMIRIFKIIKLEYVGSYNRLSLMEIRSYSVLVNVSPSMLVPIEKSLDLIKELFGGIVKNKNIDDLRFIHEIQNKYVEMFGVPLILLK